MSESAGVAITTALSILVIIDIVGNSLVCLIIKRNRDLRAPMNYLLVNLAVADILFAAFIAPSVILRLKLNHPDGMTGTLFCKFLTGGNVAWVGGIASVLTLVAIAIERFYAVMYPLDNKAKLTKCKLKVIIPSTWIFSVIFYLPLFLVAKFDKEKGFCTWKWPEKWMRKAYSVVWFVFVVLPLLLMVTLYSRVVYTLWFIQCNENRRTFRQRGVTRFRKRVTLMVAIVSAIFGISWGPDSIVYLLRTLTSYHIGPAVVAVTQTMVLFNAAVNPFVYALLNQRFREKIKALICFTDTMATRGLGKRGSQSIELATYPNPRKGSIPISDGIVSFSVYTKATFPQCENETSCNEISYENVSHLQVQFHAN